jgi:hypothetical protein
MREGDQIWMISSRNVGCGKPSQLVGNLKYSVYAAERGWLASSREAFLESLNPEVATTFYVHGNQVNNAEAQRIAANVYRSLVGVAPPDQPMQFVVWSWPSERIDAGPLEDIRVKAQRTPVAGYYLGWLVNQLPPEQRVTLIGYSFGARIVTGALHLAGGGRLAGDVVMDRKPGRTPLGAILMAAAVDDDWLRAGMPHGKATSQIDRLLLVNNSADAALRRYHLLYGLRRTADAMGTYGPAGYAGGAFVIDEFDAACIVGKEHNWELYFASPAIMRRMQPAVFATSTPLQITKQQGRNSSPSGTSKPVRGAQSQASSASGAASKKDAA